MDIKHELEDNLMSQRIAGENARRQEVERCLQTVKAFVEIENALAVMSNLISNESYICAGAFGRFFGMGGAVGEIRTIPSIWEENIYERIHPEDLLERHVLELRFFHFLKRQPVAERLKYKTSSCIRAKNAQGDYVYIHHQTLYLRSTPEGKLWLALCLYNFWENRTIPQHGIEGVIQNRETGEIISLNSEQHCPEILSRREREILSLVEKGFLSKEIAAALGISLNTVNRHRQNILTKLQVNNSHEAVRTARAMNLLP